MTGRIRLVNGPTPWMGRVEVSYEGAWATVSGTMYGRPNTFDDKAAKVVCRMLGYPTCVLIYSLLVHYKFERLFFMSTDMLFLS